MTTHVDQGFGEALGRVAECAAEHFKAKHDSRQRGAVNQVVSATPGRHVAYLEVRTCELSVTSSSNMGSHTCLLHRLWTALQFDVQQ